MDDQSADTLDPVHPRASSQGAEPGTRTAEYELRLRSTERVRTVVQRSCLRRAAPSGLVVKIRESLIVIKG